jgi:hypothetical protein
LGRSWFSINKIKGKNMAIQNNTLVANNATSVGKANNNTNKVPIISIISASGTNSVNGNNGSLFGESLQLINYKKEYSGITYNNDQNIIYDNNIKNILSTSFSKNDTIKVSSDISTKDLYKNDIKYITSVPIKKILVQPIPEQQDQKVPTSIINTPENESWFINKLIFQNTSPVMTKSLESDNLDATETNEGLINKLDLDLLFNTSISFDIDNITYNFQFLFREVFNLTFTSVFILNFEGFKDNIIEFLVDNIMDSDTILNIELENPENFGESEISLSTLFLEKFKNLSIEERNATIENIQSTVNTFLNEYSIRCLKTETYFNNKNFRLGVLPDTSFGVLGYNTIKLYPDTPINLDELDKTYFLNEHYNEYAQVITEENTKIYNIISKEAGSNGITGIMEEINILRIHNQLNTSPEAEESIKIFLKLNLIKFITDSRRYPNRNGLNSSDYKLRTIPTEISYNTFNKDRLQEIGKRQLIINFENEISLTDSLIPAKIFVLQYNLDLGRLELIPVIDSKRLSEFQEAPEINKIINYSKKDIDNGNKLLLNIEKTYTNVLDNTSGKRIITLDDSFPDHIQYLNYSIFGLAQELTSSDTTNSYRLKLLRKFELTEENIIELNNTLNSEVPDETSTSLTYSSYALNTIYIS